MKSRVKGEGALILPKVVGKDPETLRREAMDSKMKKLTLEVEAAQ